MGILCRWWGCNSDEGVSEDMVEWIKFHGAACKSLMYMGVVTLVQK